MRQMPERDGLHHIRICILGCRTLANGSNIRNGFFLVDVVGYCVCRPSGLQVGALSFEDVCRRNVRLLIK